MLKSPYTLPENNLFYQTEADNDFHLFLKREPYLLEMAEGNMDKVQIPKDCYFVMGDNRNDSHDSRYWNTQFVSKDDILGEALFVYWPGIKLID